MPARRGGVAAYAFLAPRLRILRATSIADDILNLMSYVGDLQSFLSALRTTKLAGYLQGVEELDLETAERVAWRFYLDGLMEIRGGVPGDAEDIYRFYLCYAASRDVALIGRRVVEGEEVKPDELVAGDVESVAEVYVAASERGLEGYIEGLRRAGLVVASRVLRRILEEGGRIQSPDIELALDTELLWRARAALQRFRGKPAAAPLCCRVDLLALRVAGNLALAREKRAVETVWSYFTTCRLDAAKIREAIEVGGLEALTSLLRETPYGSASGSGFDVLSEQMKLIRTRDRRDVLMALASNPLTPALMVGVLELLLLDVEDLVALMVAAYTGSTEPLKLVSLAA